MADVAMKEINLSQEIYIHYKKQNYLNYRKTLGYIEDWGLISSIYQKDANELKTRMSKLNLLTNKDGKTVADALGILNDISGKSSVFNDIEQRLAIEVGEKIRQGIGQSTSTSYALMGANSVANEIQILDRYIQNVKDVIATFEKNNDDFLSYLLSLYENNSKVQNNIKNLYSVGDKLNLLAINQTALTSFQSLNTRIEQLENARNALISGDKDYTVQYKDKSISYKSLIYPMHQLFINILGGLGEGFGAAIALKELENFMKNLKIPNMTVEIEGTGTGKTTSGKTNKADYTISINDETGEILLSFGISAKAQNLKKGKEITTTFETTKLKKVMEAFELHNNVEKYIFYNNLYQKVQDNTDYYLRRKIAAANMLNSVTGLKQGENVLFLQYLDSLIRVDEFFEGLSKAGKDNLPTLKVSGISNARGGNYISRKGNKLNNALQEKDFQDLNPNDKNIVAWVRSRQVIRTLDELSTQIQLRHK